MDMNYKVKVINNPNGLPLRDSPVLTSSTSGTLANGKDFIANDMKTSMDGTVWFHISEYNKWAVYQSKNTTNMRILGEVVAETVKEIVKDATDAAVNAALSVVNPTMIKPAIESATSALKELALLNAAKSEDLTLKVQQEKPSTKTETYISTTETASVSFQVLADWFGKDKLQQNNELYPTVISKDNHDEYVYDWSMDTRPLADAITKIKRDMNIPSGYTRDELNILMNNSFNRYKITYPDYMASGLHGVAFFTRPDLNLVDDNGNYLEQVTYEPQLYYITRNNSMVLKQLTASYTGAHEFLPLLCNTCKSLDVNDESVDTIETGETFSGNKIMYAKHNIKSLVAGTFNCRFIDSYDMAVTHLFQGWCTYESNVFLGTMSPKLEYIGSGQIDYAGDAYVFMLDRMNAIKFFTKYYGVFPTSVGKSAFSYNEGDPQHFPEQNITFAYFAKEDLNPTSIVEFNAHSGLPFIYKTDHDNKLGHGGNTWSGPPFVELKNVYNGTSEGSDQLYLRYRQNVKYEEEEKKYDDALTKLKESLAVVNKVTTCTFLGLPPYLNL